MTKKQYAKMDWEAIESIVYSDNAHPFEVLAPQKSGKETLIQAFLPYAKEVELIAEGDEETAIKMELVDEEGFYAVFVPGSAKKTYCFKVTNEDGDVFIVENPYNYAPVIPKDSFEDFINGTCVDAYRVLGAHKMSLYGREGVNFAVWAPNALRVSVVGEWNHWDGRVHPMEKLSEYGIFTLFIPGVKEGDAYRFELKVRGSDILIKEDPYATLINDEGCAVVNANEAYSWSDKRKLNENLMSSPMHIAQVSLTEIVKGTSKGKKKLTTVVKEAVSKLVFLGYTHVELAPVSACSPMKEDAYQTLFYYAADKCFQGGNIIKEFVNECHKAGLCVIADWSVAYFAKDSNGLEWFDGSNLYEHADKRQGYQPKYDANVFRYQNPGVKSFLLSNAYYMISEYHFDGLSMKDIASVLYLDYGRNDWVCNRYGGKENLEFVDFVKELNVKLKSDFAGCITIADIDAVWSEASDKYKNSLGFDFVWNNGFKKNYVNYIRADFNQRSNRLLDMLSGLDYAYNEHFVLPLSSDVVSDGLITELQGSKEEQYASMRASLAYLILYPGKKLSAPSAKALVETGNKKEKRSDADVSFEQFVADLNKLYKSEKLFYGLDENEDGFAWVNHEADVENVVTFIRKSGKKNDILYVVANFSNVSYDALNVTVPFAGKYKEIFSTAAKEYGGDGTVNEKEVATEEKPYDETVNTLTIKAAPLSMSVFSYKPFTDKEIEAIKEHKRQLRIAYVKSERAKIEKRRDEIIADAVKDAENRIKELEKILEEK